MSMFSHDAEGVGNINSYSDKGDILILAEASSFELGCV